MRKIIFKESKTMKNLFKDLSSKFVPKRHYLIVNEGNVLEVLRVIDKQNVWYVKQNLSIDNCGWADDRKKWFIHFDTSDNQWMSIIDGLEERGFDLVIRNKRIESIFVIKRQES